MSLTLKRRNVQVMDLVVYGTWLDLLMFDLATKRRGIAYNYIQQRRYAYAQRHTEGTQFEEQTGLARSDTI